MIKLFFLQVSYKYAKISNTNRNIITTTIATAIATAVLLRLWLSAMATATATATYYITIISIYYVLGSFELGARSN